MGNENVKGSDGKKVGLPNKEITKLSSKDYKFLTKQTGNSKTLEILIYYQEKMRFSQTNSYIYIRIL